METIALAPCSRGASANGHIDPRFTPLLSNIAHPLDAGAGKLACRPTLGTSISTPSWLPPPVCLGWDGGFR
jgi:hypothetical protein